MQITKSDTLVSSVVGGATSYTFELLNAAAGAVLSTSVQPGPSCPFADLVGSLPVGNYNARCRATDGTLVSPDSDLLPLEYSGLAKPVLTVS